jgi:hypothetical protein
MTTAMSKVDLSDQTCLGAGVKDVIMVGAVSGERSWGTLQRNSDERPNASRMRNAKYESQPVLEPRNGKYSNDRSDGCSCFDAHRHLSGSAN